MWSNFRQIGQFTTEIESGSGSSTPTQIQLGALVAVW